MTLASKLEKIAQGFHNAKVALMVKEMAVNLKKAYITEQHVLTTLHQCTTDFHHAIYHLHGASHLIAQCVTICQAYIEVKSTKKAAEDLKRAQKALAILRQSSIYGKHPVVYAAVTGEPEWGPDFGYTDATAPAKGGGVIRLPITLIVVGQLPNGPKGECFPLHRTARLYLMKEIQPEMKPRKDLMPLSTQNESAKDADKLAV